MRSMLNIASRLATRSKGPHTRVLPHMLTLRLATAPTVRRQSQSYRIKVRAALPTLISPCNASSAQGLLVIFVGILTSTRQEQRPKLSNAHYDCGDNNRSRPARKPDPTANTRRGAGDQEDVASECVSSAIRHSLDTWLAQQIGRGNWAQKPSAVNHASLDAIHRTCERNHLWHQRRP
jgi:hypothetical protein